MTIIPPKIQELNQIYEGTIATTYNNVNTELVWYIGWLGRVEKSLMEIALHVTRIEASGA